ncbi:MAG: hypothetical protein JEZ12_24815 [Desulfobacterium sp.]|nr:hypothetical protein [Desulfobacterium sp.]
MDLDVLQYVIDNEHEHLIEAVESSGSKMETAVGVGKLLLANNGDLNVLKGRQNYVYKTCIEPVFTVGCDGIYGDDTCTGNGWVDEESLFLSYQEEEFLCQHCRFDADRIAAE